MTIRTEEIPCPGCESRTYAPLFRSTDRAYGIDGEFDVVRCDKCGLAFTNPRPVVEDLALCYPSRDYFRFGDENIGQSATPRAPNGEEARSPFRRIAETFLNAGLDYELPASPIAVGALRAIRPLWLGPATSFATFRRPRYRAGGRLLEVGCGKGISLLRFSAIGWKVVGTDLNREACRYASTTTGLDVVQADAELLPFADETFDAIYLHHVLEHLPHPLRALAEFARVLRPRGQVVLEVPNFGSIQARRNGPVWRGLEIPRHLCHFEKQSLSRMLVLSGLRTVQVRGIVGSTHDIFCPTLPPTFENDEKYRGKWWRRGAVTAIAGLVGPVCGVADSLYAIAKKG